MQQEDQISTKDIILKIIGFKNSIIKNWKLVILFAILGGGAGFAYDYFNLKEPSYKATNKFYLETAVPQTNAGGFASMFGVNIQQNNGLFSGTNLLSLITSSDFIERILLKEVEVDNKKHLLVNFFYDKHFTKKMKEDPQYKFTPLTHTDKKKYTVGEFDNLNKVAGAAMGSALLTPEDGTSFYILDVTTGDDTLSMIYSENFLQTLKEYYLESNTSKLKTSLEKQQRIVDSLKTRLNSTDATLARTVEINETAVSQTAKVQETRLNRNSQMLVMAIQQQEQILNQYKFELYKDTPLFKVTTPQRFPIIPKVGTLTKTYKTGIIIGIFFCFLIIVIRDAYRSIMKEESSKTVV